MSNRLDLTELNKLFNKPSPNPPSHKTQTAEDQAWLQQFFTRVRFIESLNAKPPSGIELSPSSSVATLVDDEVDTQDFFGVSKVEEPFFSIADIQMRSFMNEHSDYFLDEFHGRTGHREVLSMNTDLPSYRSTPSPSSSISSTSFNPNAEPFVPTFSPLIHVTTSSLSSEHIPWFSAFWAGVSTDDAAVHHLHAVALVDSMQWTPEALWVLSQHF